MASHIQLIEDGRPIGLDGTPLASRPLNAWLGFPLEVHPHMRQREVAHRTNPCPLVLLRTGSHGRARFRSGLKIYDLELAPGQVDVFPDGFQMDHGWWDCSPGEIIAIELRSEMLHNLLREEVNTFRLRPVLAARDPILEQLIHGVRREIDCGCPSGILYAQGVSLAILGCLLDRYAETPLEAPKKPRLSEAQAKKVVEYIDARLATRLDVARLADLLDLSPHHFARLFKSAVGMTPHRFILERRIQAARRLLTQAMPLADIAYAVGFSSQSHFTEIFRKYTGNTPSRARKP